ncbi:ATP-binding protein [Ramlibacter tataouinensis]|uniref:sensor histidine kinase n=1 Tax=Ramlibacter tataouinensis TaxID=94132 RepID=UPI0022F3BE45|nr:sensor histidine kinase [Ramlibacter tataouinensis]WBY02222.1 ATP-binding protein [Ramlibacter tataouinensis]
MTPLLRRRSLGTYLAVASTLLSVLLTIVLGAVGDHTASKQMRLSIGNRLAELALQTASRMDRATYERHREVQLMAQRLGPERDGRVVARELGAMQASYRHYAWLGVTDAAGRVRTSSSGLLEGADVSGRPWFREAIEGRHLGDVHEAVLLARALGKPAGRTPPRFFDIAFPMHDPRGRLLGVLGAHVSWEWARDVRRTIFTPVDPNSSVEPLIVSRAGEVLLGPADLEGRRLDLPSVAHAARGASGHDVETWPDGRTYLVGYARTQGFEQSPGLGWSILVRQELKQAYEPVAHLRQQLLLWGVGTTLLFSLAGWLVARWITRPLLQVARGAKTLEAGGAPALDVPASAYREVHVLGGALSSLMRKLRDNEDNLRELNAGLEKRVEERTAKLRLAYEQVRANEQRIQVILESAQDPFLAFDLQGRVIEWNSRAESLFGWTREEILGKSVAETLVPARFAGSLRKAFEAFARGDRPTMIQAPFERIMVDRLGREVEVEARVGLVDTGPHRFFAAFVHDISQRKEVDRLKSEFVSTVSHELRTPLTAIHGSLQLLQSGMAGDLPEDARELVALSAQSSERLVRLVNDVLDLERIASGRMQYAIQPCLLSSVAMHAIRDVQPLGETADVRVLLEAAEPLTVLGDFDRLVQVAINLLANAVKFSPPGGVVRVSVRREGNAARFGVVDHGAGVPEGFRTRVFERFAQADSSDRRQRGGTGLGLSICRAIVEAHHGRIDFTSEPGVRTEFFFEIAVQE